jgi:hypothetical protein
MARTVTTGDWKGKISVVSVMLGIHVQEGILVGINYVHMDIIVIVEKLNALLERELEQEIFLHASALVEHSLNSKEPHVSSLIMPTSCRQHGNTFLVRRE